MIIFTLFLITSLISSRVATGELLYINKASEIIETFTLRENVGIFQTQTIDVTNTQSLPDAWVTIVCKECHTVSVNVGIAKKVYQSQEFSWFLPDFSDFVVERFSIFDTITPGSFTVTIEKKIVKKPVEMGLAVKIHNDELIIQKKSSPELAKLYIDGIKQTCELDHCNMPISDVFNKESIYLLMSSGELVAFSIDDAEKDESSKYPISVTPTVFLYANAQDKDSINIYVGVFDLPEYASKIPHVFIVDVMDYNRKFLIGSESSEIETKGLIFVVEKGPAFIINVTLMLIESKVGETGSFVAAHWSKVYEKPPITTITTAASPWWGDDNNLDKMISAVMEKKVACPQMKISYTSDLVPSIDTSIDGTPKIHMIGSSVIIDEMMTNANEIEWLVELDGTKFVIQNGLDIFWFQTRFGQTHRVRYHILNTDNDENCTSEMLTITPPPEAIIDILPDVIGGRRFMVRSNLPIQILGTPVFTSMSTSIITYIASTQLDRFNSQFIHVYEIANVRDEADFYLKFQLPFGSYTTGQMRMNIDIYQTRFVFNDEIPQIAASAEAAGRQSKREFDENWDELKSTESSPLSFTVTTDRFDVRIIQVESRIDAEITVTLPYEKITVESSIKMRISTDRESSSFTLPKFGIYIITSVSNSNPSIRLSDFYMHSPRNIANTGKEYTGIDWEVTSRGDIYVPCPFDSKFQWPLHFAYSSDSGHEQGSYRTHIIDLANDGRIIPFSSQYNAKSAGKYAIELVDENDVLVPVSVVTLISPFESDSIDVGTFDVISYPTCRGSPNGKIRLEPLSLSGVGYDVRIGVSECITWNGAKCQQISISSDGSRVLSNVPFFETMIVEFQIADMCRVYRKLTFAPPEALYPSKFTISYEPTCENRRILVVSPHHPSFRYRHAAVDGHPEWIDVTALTSSEKKEPFKYETSVWYGANNDCLAFPSIVLMPEEITEAPKLKVNTLLPIYCPQSNDAQVIIDYSGVGKGFYHNGLALEKKYISTRTKQLIVYDLTPGEHVFMYESDRCQSSVRLLIDEKKHHDLITHVEINALESSIQLQNGLKFRPDMFNVNDRQYLSADFTKLSGMPNGHMFTISVIYPSDYIRHDGQVCSFPLELTTGQVYHEIGIRDDDNERQRRTIEKPIYEFSVTNAAQVIRPPKIPENTCIRVTGYGDKGKELVCLTPSQIDQYSQSCTYYEDKPIKSCLLPMPRGNVEMIKYLYVPVYTPISSIRKEAINFEKHYFTLVEKQRPAPKPLDKSYNPPTRFVFDLHWPDSGGKEPVITLYSSGFFKVTSEENDAISGCYLTRSTETPWPAQCDISLSKLHQKYKNTEFKLELFDDALKVVVFSAQVVVNFHTQITFMCHATETSIDFFVTGGYPPYYIFGVDDQHVRFSSASAHLPVKSVGVYIPKVYDSSDNAMDAEASCIVEVAKKDEEDEVNRNKKAGVYNQVNHVSYFESDFAIIDVKNASSERRGCGPEYTYSMKADLSSPILHGTEVIVGFYTEDDPDPIISCQDDRLETAMVGTGDRNRLIFFSISHTSPNGLLDGIVVVCMENMDAQKMMTKKISFLFEFNTDAKIGTHGSTEAIVAATGVRVESGIVAFGKFPVSLVIIDERECPYMFTIGDYFQLDEIRGCDGVLFSNKVFDSCGVCDGTGNCVMGVLERTVKRMSLIFSSSSFSSVVNGTNSTNSTNYTQSYSHSASSSNSEMSRGEDDDDGQNSYWFLMSCFMAFLFSVAMISLMLLGQ